MNSALLVAHFDRITEAPNAVPRLRGFVLDLAVRGKSVGQNPLEEPAARLMNSIRAAKGLPNSVPGIETVTADDRPFEIPGNWIWVRLGEICSKTGVGQHSTRWEGGLPAGGCSVSSLTKCTQRWAAPG